MKKDTLIKICVAVACVVLAVCLVLLGINLYNEREHAAQNGVIVTDKGLSLSITSLDGYNSNNYNGNAVFEEATGKWKGVTAADYVSLPSDLSTIKLSKTDLEPSDKQIASSMASMAGYYDVSAIYAKRACVKGDSVVIDYVGKVKGVAFNGGTTSSPVTITLGNSGYIAGFDDQIIGHQPGETFDINVTFPKGYNSSTDADGNTIELSEAEAVFTITLHGIDGEYDYTDTWVNANMKAGYGLTTVAEFKEYCRTNLFNRALLEKLTKQCKFNGIPNVMLENEVNYLLSYIQNFATYYGVSVDTLLSYYGYKDLLTFVNANASTILENCQQYLLVQALAEKLNVTVSDADKAQHAGEMERYGTGSVMNSILSTNTMGAAAQAITLE